MRIVALSLLALSLAVLPAHAATMYEYTGNPFTTVNVGDACLGDCALSFSFVTDALLPANASGGVFTTRGQMIMGDGVTVYDTSLEPAHLDDHFFILETDAAGLPSKWHIDIEVFRSDGSLDGFGTLNYDGGIGDGIGHACCDPSLGGRGPILYSASNENSPGTWRIVTVPEPMSLLLMVVGIAALSGAGRLRTIR
jgi:hypothetical protein